MLPRVKLLQATSPECATYPGQAIAGEFWGTTLTMSLGNENLLGVPLYLPAELHAMDAERRARPGRRRSGAGAEDFIHWDPPDGVFHVRFPNNPEDLHLEDRAHRAESLELDVFGSSRSRDDPKSHPAATLTFEVLWFLPDFNTLALTLNSRGGIQPAKQLFAMTDAKPANPFDQRYKICSQRKPGPSGESYFGYIYRGDGYCDVPRALSAITERRLLFQQWKDVAFATADESEEEEAPAKRPEPAPYREPEARGSAQVIDDDIPF